MFYLNKDTELNATLLNKMINRFNLGVKPKLEQYKDYYDGLHSILRKSYADESKPCSRTVVNYCKNIVDSYSGYIASPGYISYQSADDIEEIMNVLRYNDYQTQDNELLNDALIYGVGIELMFLDSASQVRFRTINPTTAFGVYDDTLTGDLMYFVRMYKANEWDDSDTFNVDVYSDSTIKHYKMSGYNGNCIFVSEEQHHFAQCPANIFYLPEEESIFHCIKGLQDSVNELLSSEIDDYSSFCDAYLILEGVDADAEDIAAMRKNRAASIPEGAKMYYLTKNANDTQVENIIKRIHDSIYRIAQCPDFSSESFVGGVSSGIAIRYRLTGMENRAGTIEGKMRKALQRRIEIICGIATLKLGEEVFRDIDIEFKRNIPEDLTATINMINSLKGTVSDATLLSQLPFVSDVNAEIEAVAAQKQANMELYSFAPLGDEEEDDA